MKVAIMQPYLFPYIGYFQLINSVDLFVICDDVQYIKGGWINRNRILVNNHDHMFTFSLKKDSSHLNINKRYFSERIGIEKQSFLKTLKASYGKLERYDEVSCLIEEVLSGNVIDQDISKIITRGLKVICNYLDIHTKILFSSEIPKNNELTREDRVIEINKQLHATHYINPIGGMELYSKGNFLKHNINLSFLKSKPIQYKQNGKEFIPWLSIIDVLMFNSRDEVKQLLDEYELL